MTNENNNRKVPHKSSNQGFASDKMSPELKRKIQSMGGKASHGGGRPKKRDKERENRKNKENDEEDASSK